MCFEILKCSHAAQRPKELARVDTRFPHILYDQEKSWFPKLAFNSATLGLRLLKLYRILSQPSPGTFPSWRVLHFRIYALSFLKLKISCLSLPHLAWARVEQITLGKYIPTNWWHRRKETKSTLEINLSRIFWGSSRNNVLLANPIQIQLCLGMWSWGEDSPCRGPGSWPGRYRPGEEDKGPKRARIGRVRACLWEREHASILLLVILKNRVQLIQISDYWF